ncbi:uncharacterized protein LOC118409113 [Branchiostoma floridae]|uniref:Uncharacterized protein LOC118409113 n=1 Tax=Branchiostoma floridae TaxID=7739 RepID=A0A9J7KLZ8_BRAFL|nr:uncharacterized protein LOC118409113 [Branchiostoma floridae]
MKLTPSVPFFLLYPWFVFTSASIELDAADQYRCTFDSSICSWTIEGPVYHGGAAGCDYGWPDEALHGVTAPGMYICFFLDDLHMMPTNFPNITWARFTSPNINTTHHVVLSFAIGTVRPPTSTYLSVILVNETGTETLLCSTSDLLFPWQRVYVGIVQSGPYKIVIEGIPDPPFYPNFGIDDLTLTAVQNATANVGVQTTNCSTEMLTTVPMTTWQYNTTRPMTSGQVHTTTPTAGGQDATAFPQTSGQQVTTLPMATSNNTPTVPTASIQGTSTFLSTATTDVATGCTCANTCPPVGSEFPHMATNSPHGDPVVASSRSSSGVDPAVCAGIAITTAAVGVVVGVLATLLVHRLRNGTEASEVNGTAGHRQNPSNPLYGIPMESLSAHQDSASIKT